MIVLSLLYSDEVIDLDDDQWADINIVSGCLKLYLRELPDPLIPFRLFRGFIDAASKLLTEFRKVHYCSQYTYMYVYVYSL